MRVLRAILGRFARFLVRIARTLDPALATAPYWVLPERMAELRQRYPGAPEHWLEFVARRSAIGEPASPPPPAPEPQQPVEPPQAHARPRVSLRNLLGGRGRPAVAFPGHHMRPNARPSAPQIAPATHASPPAAPSTGATRKTPRPGLTFSTKSVRNPIANLLRIGRPKGRPAMLHFHSDDPAGREHREAPGPEAFARREHQTFFPSPDARPTHRPEAIGADDWRRDATGVQADIRWPARPERSSTGPSWLNERPGAVRPDPSFRTHDPRWPELPRLADESAPTTMPSLDEAILRAEQIGGTWSG